jgi:hypothetical protein
MLGWQRRRAVWLPLALMAMTLAQQATAQPARVYVEVATPSDFVHWVNNGASHITITEHLDLRGPTRLDSLGNVLGAVNASNTLRSIRVRSQRRVRRP